MRISDWSSDVCSSDLNWTIDKPIPLEQGVLFVTYPTLRSVRGDRSRLQQILDWAGPDFEGIIAFDEAHEMGGVAGGEGALGRKERSEEHTSKLQSLMRIPYAVFCCKKKNYTTT